MSAEQNKALARRFYEVFNSGNVEPLDAVVPVNYIQHTPGVPPGRDGVQMFMGMFRAAFPDVHLHTEDLLADGDRVVGRWTVHGTQQGEIFNIPATGKAIHLTGIDIWRVENGLLAEHWDAWNQLGMMQQLGVMPGPGQSGG
jgi:steroid delta-isomerase-like uncharacterized protein